MKRVVYSQLLLLALSNSAEAQSSRVLQGVVQDLTGAVVAGAEVNLLAEDGRLLRRSVVDRTGLFRFPSIAKGVYFVDVHEAGFKENKQKVRVGAETAPVLHVSLTVAGKDETVVVEGGTASTHVTNEIEANQNSNDFSRDALDRLPVFNGDYITTLSRFLDPDATGTNGVTLVVNGVEANGPGVTPSAVTSVKINQNPYSALFSRPGRARVEITTESGTPQFHGTANFLYRDSLFDATNPFAILKPGEQRTYYEGSLTGPLFRKGKNTFLLSLDHDKDNQEAVVVAALPTSSLNENVPNPTNHEFFSGRIFHDYSPGNQIWVGYSFEHETVTNQGVGGIVLPEAGSNTLFVENELNVGDTYVASPRMLNQLHFLVGENKNQVQSVSVASQIIVSGSFTGGGAQADTLRTEYHFDGTDILTFTAGKHELKFGIDVPDISRRGRDDDTNQLGTYSFASLNDYTRKSPFSYLVQSGQTHVAFVEKTVAGIFEDTVRASPKLSLAVGVRYYWQNYFHDIAHNVAPRFSFAFAPKQKGGTVLRGGAGVFFDRTGPSPISDLLHFNGVLLKRYLLLNPTDPATQAEIAAVSTSVVSIDPRARIPYTLQYGIGVEQQITPKSSAAINYVGTRGIDRFRSVDQNAPLPPDFASRPNPSLGQIRELQSEGYLKGNSLEVSFRGAPSSFFTGQAQYTLSKTYNNTSGITYFPANSLAPNADWGRSDNDRRHRVNLLETFLVKNWFTFGTALSAYSGIPVNVTTGNDENNDGMALDRPAATTRNSLHGPGYLDLDLNLAHDFALTRDKKKGPVGTLSINSFNVINHQNDLTYVGVESSPFFDHPVAAQPPRRMQLNLELKF